MKLSNIFNLIITFLLLAVTSCNKNLGLTPSDFIDASKAYRNIPDINLGLIGAYAALGTSSITNTSLITDETMLPTENTTGGNVSTYRWQYDGSNTTITAGFDNNYIAIDRINRVLSSIDIVPVGPTEATIKERYRGELLAMRAYCHFELLRQFASAYEPAGMGIAYMEKSENTKPSRLSVAESIAKIKADLVKAKALIPASFDTVTRITLPAVSAMQGRLALYEKNWDDAITFSTEVINAKPLASKTVFPTIWTDVSTAEVVWKLKRASSADGLLGGFYTRNDGLALYVPSFELVNKFDSINDIRFKPYIKYDKTRGTGKSVYLVNKYVGGSSVVGLADIKLFRTGEMYLIRAEAYAEKNNLASAVADINTLRAARINGYSNVAFASKENAIAEIYTERFKELAFEGHRFFDLRRRNMNIDREASDAVNALGAVLLTPNEAQYAFPIPDAEWRANKNYTQNPKY